MTIAGVAPTTTDAHNRMTMLLWGHSGCGKTVLASTAPKKILYMNFDPDGMRSLKRSPDIIEYDFTALPTLQFESLVEGKAVERDLGDTLAKDKEIRTVVVDSVTTVSSRSIDYAVQSRKAGAGATTEQPGKAGYGIRNRVTLSFVNIVLRTTYKHNCNVILICHEDAPVTDKENNPVKITIILGGSLPIEVPLQISEVWHMRDDNKRRFITIRPSGLRVPMRSRMFKTMDAIDFEWKYNQETERGEGINDWFERWKANNFNKIDVPK